MRGRAVRRVVGLLRARLPELGLEEVPDPRAREGRWSLAQILQATLLGLMAGCRSLSDSGFALFRYLTAAPRHSTS